MIKMDHVKFKEFLDSQSNLDDMSPRDDSIMRKEIERYVRELKKIEVMTRESLARFIEQYPHSFPILAMCSGLGQEQLKNQLRLRMGTTGWVHLARKNADELIKVFDDEFNLVKQVQKELSKKWTFSDVLLERHLWSRRHGAKSVGRGRNVEDEVEKVVISLGLKYEMRTRFIGRAGETAPCDLAIPKGDADALIVVAMKGFNSTGSKLTDAVGEIEKMASVRFPRQFLFVVIDGIGWLSRQADLRKIHTLWERKEIDGLYSLKHLDQFKKDIMEAAIRLDLLQKITNHDD